MVNGYAEGLWVMEDVNPSPGNAMAAVSGNYVDLDLIDDLLFVDDWLEIPFPSFVAPSASLSTNPYDPSNLPPLPDTSKGNVSSGRPGATADGGTERLDLLPSYPAVLQGEEGNHDGQSFNQDNSSGFHHYGGDPGPSRSWAVQPTADLALVPSIKERITYALMNIKESSRDRNVLVQMWVPVHNGSRRILTTCGQPFWLDFSCERLVGYREVSTNYNFSAEENSEEALGLPGRVFLGKVPEWTPDVRLFSSKEYPRVNYAQRYDVRGSLALPVFERGSRSCLGVVEIVLTTEKINYSSDLEKICNALQAVDLRTSDVLSVTHVKASNNLYQAALPEIHEVLEVVCKMHKLPLAQTWIPCIFQGRIGTRHNDENYKNCVSTADSACFINDPSMLGFHEACSEHHLFKGQGVVGKAFTTNQPCFSPDITAMSKSDYPLSHHARMFNLRSAVAIRLRSVQTGTADFVLELFLPVNCIDFDEQKQLLNSLSVTIKRVCRTLRVVSEKELTDEIDLFCNPISGDQMIYRNLKSDETRRPKEEEKCMVGVTTTADPSWMSTVPETLADGKNETPLPGQYQFEDQDLPGFSVTTGWGDHKLMVCREENFPESKEKHNMDSDGTGLRDSVSGECGTPNTKRTIGKKRMKAEKTISLQVLQQYFAGSLKNAAKSLGVCPTTLKRICRQYGISRWPSRKIKKVGHSLQKLQKVIDSVEGVDGTFQLTSLYTHFSEPSVSDMLAPSFLGNNNASLRPCDQPAESLKTNLSNVNISRSNTQSSCSQNSSSSPCSSGTKNDSEKIGQNSSRDDIVSCQNQSDHIKRSLSEEELHHVILEPYQTLARSRSHKSLIQLPSDNGCLVGKSYTETLLRVKAIYGEDKVRFKFQPSLGFQCLREEMAKRFSIGNPSSIDLRYLDDDDEWVLLTCDADLQECVDVYRSSSSDTIKISVNLTTQPFSTGSGFS